MQPLRPGDTLSKYTIEAVLGAGSTATVYRAHDAFRGLSVALKVFDPRAFEASGDELTRSGFFAEAALLGRLDHPHIVRVFDACTGPTDYFIVSEFVAGGTLADFTAHGKLMDIESALDVVFKCVKALQYLHANGVIHRDIKPENVLVGDGTDVKLGDFGAAMLPGLSQSQDVMVGSPLYMSPQRLEGAEADAQSDIFSLGVLFYQLISGKRPFIANSIVTLLVQMQSVTPAAPSSLRAGIAPEVDAIISRAIAPTIERRYQDWDTFATDLSTLFRNSDGRIRRQALASASGRFEVLRRLAFFAAFTDAELWEIVGEAHFQSTFTGDVVMREGDLGGEFYLIIEGAVRISKGGRPIDLVQPESTLGELGYILGDRNARNASAHAIEDGLTLRIPYASMTLLSSGCRGKFEQKFLRILALRLIDVNRRLSHV